MQGGSQLKRDSTQEQVMLDLVLFLVMTEKDSELVVLKLLSWLICLMKLKLVVKQLLWNEVFTHQTPKNIFLGIYK